MRLSDRSTARFRADLVAWLDEHAPTRAVRIGGSTEHRPDWLRAWQRTLFDHGWLVPTWSPELGGRDASATEHLVYLEEMAARDLPRTADPACLEGCVPAVLEHGTDEQVVDWVLPSLRGEMVWCLAAPDAGAGDLAVSAIREVGGAGWLVSGTLAPVVGAVGADRLVCPAWTGPTTSDHHLGRSPDELTVLGVDMTAPGVEVRPLPVVSSGAGPAHAVVLTGVVVGDDDVVGEVGAGTAVVQGISGRMLSAQWVASVLAAQRALDGLIRLGRDRGMVDDRDFRSALGRVHAEVAAVRALAYRGIAKEADGRAAPELSMLPVAAAAAERAVAEAAMAALGPAVLDSAGEDLMPWPAGGWVDRWLASFAPYAGGAAQREAITERVLGLPRP